MREIEKYIQVSEICSSYQVDISFVLELHENGLIQCVSQQKEWYVEREQIGEVERMIRMRQELDLNVEGIDVVVQLLQKIQDMQNEVHRLENRLRLYEND